MLQLKKYSPDGFALEIFKDRYAIHPDETFQEACERIARTMADAEIGPKRIEYFNKFLAILSTNRFSPGGRTWRGAGRPRGQLLNCFMLPSSIDSREGWGDTLKAVTIISGTGGGVGINFSRVRPRGAEIRSSGGKATGSVSLMRCINAVCNELKAGGNRRSALLFAIRYDHPDLLEFLDAKLDKEELNNANISVLIDDVFLDLIKQNKEIVFKWMNKEYGRSPARQIWKRLLSNALKCGDPGILNMGLMQKENTISYLDDGEILGTNPCFAGDTQVAVADCRNLVTIKQLAEEQKDVVLYAYDTKTDRATRRYGVAPRLTGKNQPVYKITFKDNGTIKVTKNHPLLMIDGEYKKTKDLCVGDKVQAVVSSTMSLGGDPITLLLCGKHLFNEVVSVESCGKEDVYNITVDEHHNLCVLTSQHTSKKRRDKGTWDRTIVTKNCGEVTLSAMEACTLGSINLRSHVVDGKIDWRLLNDTVRTGVRFLDNVIEQNHYPMPEIQSVCQEKRRIGLGIMGLHDMLLELNVKYSSKKARQIVDRVMGFIKNRAYSASIKLAQEKGAFYSCDSEKHVLAGFVKRSINGSLKSMILRHGIRNCAILTAPPTGTTSIMAGCSSGIEPLFQAIYKRTYNKPQAGEEQAERVVVHPLLQRFLQEGRDTSHFENAHDISPEDHLAMQATCQKHLDNAASKTLNVPPTFSVEQLLPIIEKYIPVLKGITIYRDGSKGASPLTPIPVADAKRYLDEAMAKSAVGECASGTCDTGG